ATVKGTPAEGLVAIDDQGRTSKNYYVDLSGVLSGSVIDGTAQFPKLYEGESECTLPLDSHPFTATISEDFKSIIVKTAVGHYQTHSSTVLLVLTNCDSVSMVGTQPMTFILTH